MPPQQQAEQGAPQPQPTQHPIEAPAGSSTDHQILIDVVPSSSSGYDGSSQSGGHSPEHHTPGVTQPQQENLAESCPDLPSITPTPATNFFFSSGPPSRQRPSTTPSVSLNKARWEAAPVVTNSHQIRGTDGTHPGNEEEEEYVGEEQEKRREIIHNGVANRNQGGDRACSSPGSRRFLLDNTPGRESTQLQPLLPQHPSTLPAPSSRSLHSHHSRRSRESRQEDARSNQQGKRSTSRGPPSRLSKHSSRSEHKNSRSGQVVVNSQNMSQKNHSGSLRRNHQHPISSQYILDSHNMAGRDTESEKLVQPECEDGNAESGVGDDDNDNDNGSDIVDVGMMDGDDNMGREEIEVDNDDSVEQHSSGDGSDEDEGLNDDNLDKFAEDNDAILSPIAKCHSNYQALREWLKLMCYHHKNLRREAIRTQLYIQRMHQKTENANLSRARTEAVLSDTKRELDTKTMDHDKLYDENLAQAETLRNMEMKLNDLTKKVDTITTELHDVKLKETEASSALLSEREEHGSCKEKFNTTRQELKALKKKSGDVQKEMEQTFSNERLARQTAEEKVCQTNKELMQLKSENTDLSCTVKKLSMKITDLETSIDNRKGEYKALQQGVDHWKGQATTLSKENESKEKHELDAMNSLKEMLKSLSRHYCGSTGLRIAHRDSNIISSDTSGFNVHQGPAFPSSLAYNKESMHQLDVLLGHLEAPLTNSNAPSVILSASLWLNTMVRNVTDYERHHASETRSKSESLQRDVSKIRSIVASQAVISVDVDTIRVRTMDDLMFFVVNWFEKALDTANNLVREKQQSKRDVAALENKYESVCKTIVTKEKGWEEQQLRTTQTLENASRANSEVRKLNSRVSELDAIKDELNDKVKTLTGALSQSETQLKQKQVERELLERDVKQKEDRMNRRMTGVTCENERVAHKYKMLEEKVKVEEAEKKKLQSQLEQSERMNDDLRLQLDANSRVRAVEDDSQRVRRATTAATDSRRQVPRLQPQGKRKPQDGWPSGHQVPNRGMRARRVSNGEARHNTRVTREISARVEANDEVTVVQPQRQVTPRADNEECEGGTRMRAMEEVATGRQNEKDERELGKRIQPVGRTGTGAKRYRSRVEEAADRAAENVGQTRGKGQGESDESSQMEEDILSEDIPL